MAHLSLSHHVAAEPASVALVLAAPAAADRWPGTLVTVGRPQRSGVGFISRICVNRDEQVVATGRVAIVPSDGSRPGTRVVVDLLADDGDALCVRQGGERYLAELAELGRARAAAA